MFLNMCSHEQVLQHTFCPADSCRPVLAFQPSDEDTTYLAIGRHYQIFVLMFILCSLDPLGPRASGSKLYENRGLIWTEW